MVRDAAGDGASVVRCGKIDIAQVAMQVRVSDRSPHEIKLVGWVGNLA